MTGDAGLRVTALTPEIFEGWAALLEACSSGCFCRYWHFEGNKNEWLARLATAPGTNAAEQRARLEAGHPSARGLVALGDRDAVLGWIKLAPRAAVPKLRRLPVYRALDLGPDDGVVSVACFVVRPDHRRRGVARALLRGAIVSAAEAGAKVLEAYPHCRAEELRDEELWMGPLSLLEECGFERAERGTEEVAANGAYPVLRRLLGGRDAPRASLT